MSNPPLYVSSLFKLLKWLGISQQAVATDLGVSKSIVSQWAHAKLPLSVQYVDPFMALVADAATADRPEPWTLNSGIEWEQTKQKYLTLWFMERQETVGVLARDFQRGCGILGSFARQNPAKIEPAQWDEIAEACRLVGKARRVLQLRRQPPPPRSWGSWKNWSRERLLAWLLEIAAWEEANASSDDSEEETHDAS